ncbi:MAG: hypothetical protein WCM76_12775 [Bacteroidota bacterium]
MAKFSAALNTLNQAPDNVKLGHSYGHGIGILEDEKKLDIIMI